MRLGANRRFSFLVGGPITMRWRRSMTILLGAIILVTIFSLGRYSVYLNGTTATAATMGRDGTLSANQLPRADAAGAVPVDGSDVCAHPLDMYDDEGVDEDEGDGAKQRGGQYDASTTESDVFDGTRHFVDKCLTQGTDRLEIVSRSKLKGADKNKEVVEHKDQTAFLVRDVCALGHFPKDLAHMHSWQWLMSGSHGSRRLVERMREVVVAGEDASHRERQLRNAPQWMQALEGGAIHQVVVGHRCATRDATRSFNKRTPVFHNVLVHWVRAITGSYRFLADHDADDGQGRSTEEAGALPITMFEDLDNKVYCFRHMIEREERWRWFPSAAAANGFREKYWRYLGLNFTQLHHARHYTPFAKQRKLQILVLHRDEDRHFEERKLVAFLMSKFGAVANVLYEQYDAPPNAKKITPENNITVPLHRDQLRQLYETDVLIAAHGAGLSNIVVMQPGAVVIELFPHNFRYYMYEELSRVMSLNYVAYESEVVVPSGCCKQVQWKANAADGGPTAAAGGDGDDDASQADGPHVGSVFRLNGKRDCKKCSILVKDETWYQLVKNAMATVWLRNSRLSNVHDFDVRR